MSCYVTVVESHKRKTLYSTKKKLFSTISQRLYFSRENSSAQFPISMISGVGFTNIFTRSFCARRFLKREKTDNLTVFFTLLCSVCVKAMRRTLMKLTHGVESTKFCMKMLTVLMTSGTKSVGIKSQNQIT